jgi:hypothetical protein
VAYISRGGVFYQLENIASSVPACPFWRFLACRPRKSIAQPDPLIKTIQSLHTKLFDAFNHCGLETLAAMVSDDLEFLLRPDRTVGGKELSRCHQAEQIIPFLGRLSASLPLRMCDLIRLLPVKPTIHELGFVPGAYAYGPDVGVRDRSEKYPAATSFFRRGSRSVPRYSSRKSSST